MMYLTRILLNPLNRAARRDIGHSYEMHRTVMRAFPQGYRGRVLFRLDYNRKRQRYTLYVQSEDKPNWSFMSGLEGYLAASPDEHGNPALRELDLQPRSGDVFRFRLRANPSVKSADRKTGKKKRWGILKPEDQLAWLKRKGEAGGFRIGLGTIIAAPEGRKLTGRVIQEDERRSTTHFSVRFDGLLQVTDPEKFSETIRRGVGSGKGFGFGLITLARA